jgi:hypothetical protein
VVVEQKAARGELAGAATPRCARLDPSASPSASLGASAKQGRLPRRLSPLGPYQSYAAAVWSLEVLFVQCESAIRNTGVPKKAIEKNRSLSTVPRKNGSPAA